MNKSSLSHVINDTVSITSDQHQQQSTSSGVCSLKNLLSDDIPVHSQQHASSIQQSPPSQQYNHGAGNSGSGGNSNNSTVSYGGPYSNEQPVHDYYHRSHQPPTSQPQPSHNQLSQHTQQHQNEQFNDAEASSILLSLSNQNTSNNQPSSNSNYIPPRDSYLSKDIEQPMPDVVESSNITNNIKSNSQQINRQGSKCNTMSINSICCGGESGPSESGNSIPNGSSMESSHQKYQQQSYPEDTHHQQQIVDYNNLYNHSRKHLKKPSNGSIGPQLMVNTKIPPKEPKVIQKRPSPQKRRPSEPSEYIKPKIHHRTSESNQFLHGPPTNSGGLKLTDLREQLGEDRNANRIAPIAPIQVGMEWDRSHHTTQQQHNQHTSHTHSQPYHQTRPSHNIPPQAEINRYHQPTMQKNINSPSLHGDPKFNYINSNERQLNKTSPNGPPVHVPNGYGVGPVGGMIGTHPDVLSQPSHQQPQPISITQQQMPSLRGQSSAFSNQIHKKYNDMKHDPKMKRNAPHAYISYMIYTNQMQETGKSKDGHLQQPPNNSMSNRLTISNGSPTSNNDHGMINSSMMPINYGHRDHRESQHPGYPPIQPAAPGYMHSEAVTNPGRRVSVSDPSMHSRNAPHGYPPVNGTLDEHQPPSHRQSISSISSHGSSPGLLPAHSSANSQQRILPNLMPNSSSSQRLSPTTSTSRSGSIPHQQPLPPIQSAPSHVSVSHQPHQPHHHHHSNPPTHHHHHHHPSEHTNPTHAHGHAHYHQPVSQASQPPPPVYMSVPPPLAQHSYNGKSSPAQPQPQSPINSSRQSNHYPTGPLSQGGSSRLTSSSHHHHHQHHHQSTSEPVLPNGSTQNILNAPVPRFLDSPSQPGGYGSSVHPHHHHQHLTNGVGPNHPVNIAPAQAQALGPPPRGTPNGYYV